jgi:GNAT superfamily N-acetyltransferase
VDITIAPITEADVDGAAETIASGLIFQRYGMTVESSRDAVRNAFAETAVARLDDEVVGVAIFWTHGRSPVPAYLRILAVRDGRRGLGIGAALLRYVEAHAFAGGPNLFVCCELTNHDARRFYEREGYARVGELTDLIAPGLHEVLYRKTLGPIRDYVPRAPSSPDERA